MKKLLATAFAGVALASAVAVAVAQTTVVPTVARVDADDLVQVLKHGRPTAQSTYGTAAQVNGPIGYTRSVPSTGFSLSYGAGETAKLIVPAGTLATGTLTLAANPGHGQLNCIRSTQTQSAITVAGGASSQTVTGAPTALVAATTYCMIFDATTSIWNLWSVSAG